MRRRPACCNRPAAAARGPRCVRPARPVARGPSGRPGACHRGHARCGAHIVPGHHGRCCQLGSAPDASFAGRFRLLHRRLGRIIPVRQFRSRESLEWIIPAHKPAWGVFSRGSRRHQSFRRLAVLVRPRSRARRQRERDRGARCHRRGGDFDRKLCGPARQHFAPRLGRSQHRRVKSGNRMGRGAGARRSVQRSSGRRRGARPVLRPKTCRCRGHLSGRRACRCVRRPARAS